MAGATFIGQHNNKVFENVKSFVHDEVAKAAKEQAVKMHGALRYRRYLKGEHGDNMGRYPKGDGSKNKFNLRSNEKHSYLGWQYKKAASSDFKWTIYNMHTNDADEYPYPNILAYGMDPSNPRARWRKAGGKIAAYNGRFFSSQMPRGLKPWIQGQRTVMINRIALITEIWNNKHTGGR
jgi:hypothetical protein